MEILSGNKTPCDKVNWNGIPFLNRFIYNNRNMSDVVPTAIGMNKHMSNIELGLGNP